jgi:hypothetical protein
MKQLLKWSLGLCLLMTAVRQADAFALLGPFKGGNVGDPWQTGGYDGRPQGLGYSLIGDIGGPMTPLEGYRWNVPVLTYAFDSTFLRYFGTNGVNAIEEVMAILNALPPASEISADLSEFPLDTKGMNFTAASVGLLDLKSRALSALLEQLGLASPERFVWSLRHRLVRQVGGTTITNYSVIKLNYDPITLQESSYVNGVLYNYRIFDALGPMGAEWASAVEWYQLDPLFQPYSSVAGGSGNPDFELGSSPDDTSGTISGLGAGEFFRGLTRDDVGGLRFLLSTNNFSVESLLPTITRGSQVVGTGGSPWGGFPGVTNAAGSNLPPSTNIVVGTNIVRTALRAGINKITFQRVNLDSLLGNTFTPIVHRYTDTYLNPTNGRVVKQRVERIIDAPDIIFAVRDLGFAANSVFPFLFDRTSTANWVDNSALNTAVVGPVSLGGPGVITPSRIMVFTDLVPAFVNTFSGGTDFDQIAASVWGSFDGTDAPPVVYPAFPHPLLPNLSLEYLQNVALGRNINSN